MSENAIRFDINVLNKEVFMKIVTSSRRSFISQQNLVRPYWLLLAVLTVLLLSAGLALAAKPTDATVSWPVAALSGDQTQADIAYSPDFDVYLLVFLSHEGDNWNIYGQILDGKGYVIEALTPIAVGGGEERGHPAVVYNAAASEFLVVWEETFLNQDWDIHGARLTATGSLIGNGFLIAARDNPERQPDVAYNSARNEYLVVWKQVVGEGDSAMPDVSGQRLNATGQAVGADFPVTFSNAEESFPHLAYDRDSNQYLVVWQETGVGSDVNVRGQRVSWDGSWLGGVLDIATNGWVQKDPAVAYASGPRQFLVTWSEQPNSDHRDIVAQRYASSGAPAGGRIVVSSAANDYRDAPDVVFNARKNAWLVVWEYEIDQTDHDILSRYVDVNGSLSSEYPISSALGIEAQPAVAAGSGDSSLIVWQQETNGNEDIYASVLGTPAGQPTPTPTLTPTSTPAPLPTPPWPNRIWLPVTLAP